MNSPLVLVTGGAGFLGLAVVRRCLARGYRVRILGRTPIVGEFASQVEFIRGDIADLATVDTATQGCDFVFHVAAKAGVWGPWEEYLRINLAGTSNVVAACKAHGVRALVHTSTPSVVFSGEAFRGANESLPYGDNWLCAYAETKAIAEAVALKAAQISSRSARSVRT